MYFPWNTAPSVKLCFIWTMHPSTNAQAVQTPQVLVGHIFPGLGLTFSTHSLYVNLYLTLKECNYIVVPPIILFRKYKTPGTLMCTTSSCHFSVPAAPIAEVQELFFWGLVLATNDVATGAVPVHTSWGRGSPLTHLCDALPFTPWYVQSTILSRLWAEEGCSLELVLVPLE